MALSNAIVPVLPSFAAGTASQGAVYSAYFLGAFLLVLPAGYIADRVGEVPLIRAGLALTVLSGVLLALAGSPLVIFLARLIEGIAGGLFVPAALAFLNARPDHDRMSGYFMGSLNLGLLLGLLVTGWLVTFGGSPAMGSPFSHGSRSYPSPSPSSSGRRRDRLPRQGQNPRTRRGGD